MKLIRSLLLAGLSVSCAVVTYAQPYLITDMGTLGGTTSSSQSINSSGVAVGFAYTPAGAYHAVVFTNGNLVDLGTLGGTNSSAADINQSGQVIGSANRPGSTAERAFLYTPGSGLTDLGALLTGTDSQAVGINSAGSVVGVYHNASGDQRPFVYTKIGSPGRSRPHLDRCGLLQ